MGVVVEAALWGQLWKLCEEPVTVFEETILVDCVKIVPVLIGPAFVFLCKKGMTNIVRVMSLSSTTCDDYKPPQKGLIQHNKTCTDNTDYMVL